MGTSLTRIVPAALLLGAGALSSGAAETATQPAAAPTAGAQGSAVPATSSTHGKKVSPYRPERFAGRAGTYYRMVWGVDALSVKWAESGEVIRFTYHVLDADRAKALNDKKLEPMLVDPQAGVSLVIPVMENVGQLRQTSPAEEGKSYWMVFSNKGRLVKRGDHVNVVIGAFHANGLVID
jgi:hypothetical protein